MSIFETLNAINVNEKTEKKNGLTYLSWAWAWGEVKKCYPEAVFTIYERQTEYGLVNYFTDGRTCWVKTGLTIDGLEHIEELPVMDYRNNSIPLEKVTSTDVNKAIQRSLTKAAARHGLGLYIYAGEDLPEAEKENEPPKKEEQKEAGKPFTPPKASNGVVKKASEVPPAKEENPVKKYIANELTFMKQMFGIADTDEMKRKFSEMRKSLIEAKIIEDVSSDEQTMEQAEYMIDAIYKNFSPTGKQVKGA